jgi:hypothetical protein
MPELPGLKELGQQKPRMSPTRLSHEEQDRLILFSSSLAADVFIWRVAPQVRPAHGLHTKRGNSAGSSRMDPYQYAACPRSHTTFTVAFETDFTLEAVTIIRTPVRAPKQMR